MPLQSLCNELRWSLKLWGCFLQQARFGRRRALIVGGVKYWVLFGVEQLEGAHEMEARNILCARVRVFKHRG